MENSNINYISPSSMLKEAEPKKTDDVHTGMTLEDYLDQLEAEEQESKR